VARVYEQRIWIQAENEKNLRTGSNLVRHILRKGTDALPLVFNGPLRLEKKILFTIKE
jgi:hypothetical protein